MLLESALHILKNLEGHFKFFPLIIKMGYSRKKMKTINLLSSALLITICISSTSTLAEFDDMMLDEGDEFILDEIIVTATKRKESMLDVPIALSVLNAKQLEYARSVDILSIAQLNATVAYVTAQSPSIATSLFIRGIGTQGNNTGFESSVGVFIDGVYQPRSGAALGEFVDMEQVEILRGPQGTLFGRNTSVGAISLKTKAPEFGSNASHVNLTLGDEGLKNIKGASNISVGDSLAFRFSGAIRERDGLLDTTNTDFSEANAVDQYLLRSQMLWRSEISDISSRTIIDIYDTDNECCHAVFIEDYSPLVPVVPSLNLSAVAGVDVFGVDNRTTSYNKLREEKSEQFGISNELIWKMDNGMELTWLPAFRKSLSTRKGDSDYTSNDLINLNARLKIDSFTNEIRLQGKTENGILDWLVGVFYAEEKIIDRANISTGIDSQMLADSIRDAAAVGTPSPDITASNTNTFEQDSDNLAIFTHNIFHLTEALSLTVGLRYVDESKEGGLVSSEGVNDSCLVGLAYIGIEISPLLLIGDILSPILATAYCSPAITPAGIAPLSSGVGYTLFPNSEFNDDALTYTASLRWKVNENLSTYISNSEGFKSGGINLDLTAGGFSRPVFESEVVNSWEIGAKAKWLDGNLTTQLSLYKMDIDDFQVLIVPTGSLVFETFNLDDVSSDGIELEVTAKLMSNLKLNSMFVYNEAEIGDNCTNIANSALTDLCGNNLSNAPEKVVTTSLNWQSPISNDMDFFVTPNIRYESKSQPDPADPTLIQQETTIIDLSIGVIDNISNWEAMLWAKNLTDEEKMFSAFTTFGTTLAVGQAKAAFINDPRTVGLSFKYNF